MTQTQDAATWRVRDYTAEDAEAFAALNRQWIEENFTLEDTDLAQLRDPESSIIARGGFIVVATAGAQVIGVGALLPVASPANQPGVWMQIIKMATLPALRGQGVGSAILQRLFRIAETAKADAIWLETNSKLSAATELYLRHGFTQLERADFWPSPYERCDMQMVRTLRK